MFETFGDNSLWGVGVRYGTQPEQIRQWRTGDGHPVMSNGLAEPGLTIEAISGATTDYVHKRLTWDDWIDRTGVTGLAMTRNNIKEVMFVARPDSDTFQSDSDSFTFSYPGHILSTVHCVAGKEGTFIFGFRLKVFHPSS